ncbi:MAG: amino acid adenylation domain-containing protein [Ectothiorhodospiraceae bacterium]|nr:amino acid adenylation domain-containing protein [Ectothiorhodospiraceae bacterium]
MSEPAVLDIYGLSPLQHGMLMHALQAPGSGLYFEQIRVSLEGDLDTATLCRAWQHVVDHHDILRTAFVWEDLDHPVQVLHEQVELPVLEEDWRDTPATALAARLRDFLERDRRRGFELERAPLVRLALLRTGDDRVELVLSFHHILLDGWSLGLVQRDIAESYAALRRGEQPRLAPARPFRDYIDWLAAQDPERARTYWTARLAGVTGPTPLSVDWVPGTLPGDESQYAEQASELDDTETAALQAFARGNGLTVNTLVQGAWAIVLGRYGGQDDVVFGTLTSGRPADLEGVSSMVGLFLNALPMRVRLPRAQPLGAWLAQLQTDQVEMRQFEYAALVDIHGWSDVPRRLPLFESLLAFENYPAFSAGTDDFRGLRAVDGSAFERTNYPVNLVIRPGARLRMRVLHDLRCLDAERARRLLGHLRHVLRQMAAGADVTLGDVALLDRAERDELLTRWNRTDQPFDLDRPVPTRVVDHAAADPGAVALADASRQLTYGELEAESAALARWLRAQGVGRDTAVGVLVERSVDMVVAWLAVMRAGGGYLPLDPEYPPSRLEYMLTDSGAPVLLTQETLAARAAGFAGTVHCVDRPLPASPPASSGLDEAAPDALAYLIYTSGSTGEPKGVAVEHRGLANLVAWHRRAYDVTPADRATQFAGMSFDASVWEVWPYLAAGARVHLVDAAVRQAPRELLRWLADREVTMTFLPTPVAEAVLRERFPPELRLRVMLTGGDRLHAVERRDLPFRLVNHYGPTENSVVSTGAEVEPSSALPPIGWPIDNVRVYVLDDAGEPVPLGVPGELNVAGASLARGYWGRDALTAERFVVRALAGGRHERVYRTGDLVRQRADGALEFLGRTDQQVKLRGFRIELGEIEAVLRRQPGVSDSVVVCREDRAGDPRLVGYVTGTDLAPAALREGLGAALPEYMVPSVVMVLDALPLTPNGKVDRRALPAPEGAETVGEAVAPRSALEHQLAAIWCEVLGRERVGVHDNFFDLGGHSLLLLQVQSRLSSELDHPVPTIALFHYPTISQLAGHLSGELAERRVREEARDRAERRQRGASSAQAIAVIGMAGRFPGAPDLDRLWENLVAGVESVRHFTIDELRAAGIPDAQARNPAYVGARGVLDDAELFDAAFFGYAPREAEQLDPQQRVLLECAYGALEDAGHDPQRFPGAAGVYLSASRNTYHLRQLQLAAAGGGNQVPSALLSNPEFIPMRVSYKLDLRGPSVNVQTACSSSLVAVHQACRALLDHDCDLALAGGVSVIVPRVGGYEHQRGGPLSPEGRCRPFDADATGTVPGEGVGVVVLKRLDEALADGDSIRAVIRGTAINNDGSDKVGFTAPSVEGQAGAIALALATAEVEPDSVDYVETHGTATELGDPIEIAALARVFGGRDPEAPRCRLGAVKANIGHLDAAAGVAGLIKTVLALEHRTFPPLANFSRPSPAVDFASAPFEPVAAASPWPASSDRPRRAGVSSFGMGGTNAHVVVEEAPAAPAREARPPAETLLVLSARSSDALEAMCDRLADHLDTHPGVDIADVAFTLETGRRRHDVRTAVVASDPAAAATALRAATRRPGGVGVARGAPEVAFLFPGQGAQHPGMGMALHAGEPVFREAFDACCAALAPELGVDLRELVLGASDTAEARARRLADTAITQPALFAVEYAAAELWRSWGVTPSAMLGHSIGEYVAAAQAGVMSLSDALAVVAERGRLMAALPRGAMLSVGLSETELLARIGAEIDVASVNGVRSCVVSGPEAAVERLRAELDGEGVDARRLRTSHAFHSAMMEPALAAFERRLRDVDLQPPRTRYVSNVTGTWITAAQATDPSYYARHLRQAVRFVEGLATVLDAGCHALLEVGPGRSLSALARAHPARAQDVVVAPTLAAVDATGTDREVALESLGRLWAIGVEPRWEVLRGDRRHRRVSLPTYPFQRQRYWLDDTPSRAVDGAGPPIKIADPARWLHAPSWRRAERLVAPAALGAQSWLLLEPGDALGDALAAALTARGADVTRVRPGAAFAETAPGAFTVRPAVADDHRALLARLRESGRFPHAIVVTWLVTGASAPAPAVLAERGLHALVALAQALGDDGGEEAVSLSFAADGVLDVLGSEAVVPDKAMAMGPCRVMRAELPRIHCRLVDVHIASPGAVEVSAATLLAEATLDGPEVVVAHRGHYRWVEATTPLTAPEPPELPLREGGTYLVTGGLGGAGLAFARALAGSVRANLVLVGRSGLGAGGDEARHAARAAAVRALEAAGAEVVVEAADVADATAMAAVVARARARFGRIDGAIHAAGVPGGGILQRLDVAAIERVLAPKRNGVEILAELLAADRPAFLLLCSSLITTMVAPGRADYIAANAYVDAYARAHAAHADTRVIAVNWDTWVESGMAVEALRARAGTAPDLQGLTDEEGGQMMLRALACGLPQIAVSVTDRASRRLDAARTEGRAAAQPSAAAAETARPGPKRYPRPPLAIAFVAPRTETERQIAEIWQSLLGIEPLGVDDNFFDLGGDSVLSIQVAARAGQLGLQLTPKQVFECQTIAELARACDAEPAAPAAGETALAERTGDAPLTPVQRWFFADPPAEPDHFNQSMLLRLAAGVDAARLGDAITALAGIHDVLRSRFVLVDGARVQRVVPPGDPVSLEVVDLATLDPDTRRQRLQAEAERVQASLDCARGPVLRAALFRLGEADGDRLLLAVHHLVVDAIAWGFLIEDLRALYEGRAAPGAASRATPWVHWARRLAAHADSDVVTGALEYWRRWRDCAVDPLPVDDDQGANSVASTERASLVLDAEETRALLAAARERHGAQPDEMLLAALAAAVRQWSGGRGLAVALEGHGRDAAIEGVDVSRTVGWFTAIYPVFLEPPADGGSGALVAHVRERVGAARGHQLDHGLLRYVCSLPEARDTLAALPEPEIVFVYLGQSRADAAGGGAQWQPAPEPSGLQRAPGNARRHLLEIVASIAGERLALTIAFSRNRHRAETMERLVASLRRALHDLVTAPVEPAPAPSVEAFSARKLSPDDLARIRRQLGERSG